MSRALSEKRFDLNNTRGEGDLLAQPIPFTLRRGQPRITLRPSQPKNKKINRDRGSFAKRKTKKSLTENLTVIRADDHLPFWNRGLDIGF